MDSMPAYPVLCCGPGCTSPARFKIAADWSDGPTRELKTYSLSCAECLGSLKLEAERKQKLCRMAPGEILELPAVHVLK